MTKKRKTLLGVIAAVLLLVVIVASVCYSRVFCVAADGDVTLKLYVDADDTRDSIEAKLFPMLNKKSVKGWKLIDMFYGDVEKVRTGYYEFAPGTKTFDVYNHIRHGMQTPVRLTINNARTVEQLAGKIGRQIMADSLDICKAVKDSAVCAKYGYTPQTMIAMFIPNTYEVYWNVTIEQLLDRMQKEYSKFWNEERKNKAKEIGLSPVEVAVLASIVEEETAVNDEKPDVAGLYMNRLKRGMLLQADPTVKFAVGDFTLRRILHKHLEVDSPYNTYRYEGLPPGPIRMASINGLNSVLNYKKHKYIYMCAKEDFSGRHNFATTLSEHNANARRYQRALNNRGIR